MDTSRGPRGRAGSGRAALLLALTCSFVGPALPAHSGSASQDALLFYAPHPGVVGDRAVLRWRVRPRYPLPSGAVVTAQRLVGAKWKPVSPPVPVKERAYVWDTSDIAPNSGAWISVRLVATGGLVTPSARLWVDHTPPVVSIASPETAPPATPGQPRVAITHGEVDLTALIEDLPYGVADLRWRMKRGPVSIEQHYPRRYTFPPGVTELTAVAYDFAGNAGESETITVVGLPQPA